jgi:general secretion pathway protein A
MYERFYGLRERPFEPSVDPRYLLLTGRHAAVLAHLRYRIASRHGITLLTGAAGTGKTTLLKSAIRCERRPDDIVVLIDNPALTRDEFLQAVAIGFELGPRAQESKTQLLHALTTALEAHRVAGSACTLILDEAQQLPDELLEEVRLLSNIGSDPATPFSVVLGGHPSLASRLNDPALDHLKQRIASRCHLEPMTLEETGSYIAGRLVIVGGNPLSVFDREAVRTVYQHARGIPRLISTICDAALVAGFGGQCRPVGADVVREVAAELDLPAMAMPPAGHREHAEAPPPVATLDTRASAADFGRDAVRVVHAVESVT